CHIPYSGPTSDNIPTPHPDLQMSYPCLQYPSGSLHLCTSISVCPHPDPLSFAASLHRSSLSHRPNTTSYIHASRPVHIRSGPIRCIDPFSIRDTISFLIHFL
ncbi:hypothetical protein BDR06DRAFT_949214, partial [Suillus hirtellus]